MHYEDQQFQRDQEWRAAWETMAPEQREKLESAMAGNSEYPVELTSGKVLHETAGERAAQNGRVIVGREGDAVGMCEHHADFAQAPDLNLDGMPDELREQFGLSDEQARRVANWHSARVNADVQRQVALLFLRIIGFFLLPGNLLVRAHALAHAARMAVSNGFNSLRDSAKACGVSVEAVRKVAWRWVEMLGLPPLEGAKSEAARKKYSEDKIHNHWRHQKCTTTENHADNQQTA
jgi:hypothetical protein